MICLPDSTEFLSLRLVVLLQGRSI